MLDAFPPIPAVGRAPVPKDFASSPIAARLGEDKTSTFREVRVPPAHGRAGKDDSGFDDWKKRTDNLAAAVLAAARVWRAPGSPPAKPMDNAATPAAESSNAHQDTEQDEGRRGNGHTHVPSSYMHEEQHQATADVRGDEFDNPLSDKEEMRDLLSDWDLSQSVAADQPKAVAASESVGLAASISGCFLVYLGLFQTLSYASVNVAVQLYMVNVLHRFMY